jgi:hypothetical protein
LGVDKTVISTRAFTLVMNDILKTAQSIENAGGTSRSLSANVAASTLTVVAGTDITAHQTTSDPRTVAVTYWED